jgi:hypothetical protein
VIRVTGDQVYQSYRLVLRVTRVEVYPIRGCGTKATLHQGYSGWPWPGVFIIVPHVWGVRYASTLHRGVLLKYSDLL